MAQTNQPFPEKSKKKKSKKKWIWMIVLLIIAAIVYGVISLGARVQSLYSEDVATRRDIATYYSFSGHLSPVTDETQTAKDALKVKELYVKEGDLITAGQPMLRGVDGTRVFAAESGTIDTLYVEADDSLQSGSQIARIVDYDTLEVTVDVDEYDVGALSLGKQGTVYLNALDKSVTGTVSEIARDATTDGGVSYYEVRLEIEATEDIRSGMSVEVTVLDKEVKGAVSVSTKALSYDEYNSPFVLVMGAEGAMTSRSVTLGVSDGIYTEITEGVTEGEIIYYMQDSTFGFFMMRNMQNN